MELTKDEHRQMEAEWKKMLETSEAEKNALKATLEAEKKTRQILEAQQNYQDPTDANIAIHLKNIYDTLAAIQSRLTSVDKRLSQIEADIFNIGMTTPQPGPSFSSPDVTLSSLPADCAEINLQAAVENTLPLQSLDWSPDMRTMSVTTPKQSSKRSIASSNSSVSPLVSHLPPEVANRVKKIKRTDRKTYTRGCMDALFTTKEMATSNMDGKRNKDKLDEKRVDLVKRLTYTVFPPTGESPSNKEVRDAINAKCREVKFQCKTKAEVQTSSQLEGQPEDQLPCPKN
ncbi:uncharacterized protein [Acropora muricata]|uniref:uncharacterized protein n=1 Tax=Acropora muricata TaxID=159855 RepID=UPI0034E49107